MWVIDQMAPGNPAYNMPNGFRLHGPLDLTALENGFNEIIKRHEVLRTTFAIKDGEPLQLIHPALRIKIKVTALDHLPGQEREDSLQALASEESLRSFDLSRLPLIRVSLFKLGEAEHVLIINPHHIVADGLSVGLMLKELDTFYRAFTEGGDPRLPELSVQYGDFAMWQRELVAKETAYAKQLEFWRNQLGGTLPVLELPGDKPRPALQSFKGSNVFFNIPSEQVQELKSLGAREGCTFFMTVLTVFQVLLHRYSGATDVVIGTPFAARTSDELRPLIGNFLNMIALRCNLSGDPTFIELLRRSGDTTLSAFSNSDLPFEAMIKHLKFERDPSRNPVFQVLLQVLSGTAQKIGGLDIRPFHFDLKFAQFDLSLHLYGDAGGGYLGRFEYCSDLFEAQTIRRMGRHFETLLEAVAREPDRSISIPPMLTDAERQQLLVDWNNTAVAYPTKGRCLHQLFEEQAGRTPDEVAAVFERTALTYGELNCRANQLAHHLRRKGVGPDVLVALFAERSLEMLVGIFGILKAGGAYVPIDPAYPKERIACILEDSKARSVLTQESLVAELASFAVPSLCLDADWAEIAGESRENPVTQVKSEHLAYVLFTSGSTGRPKGVALEHRSAATFVQWAKQVFTPEELASVLFSTSVCFDLSVFEMFVTLSAGGKIILARNALHLPDLPEKAEVTLLNTVPSAIAELLRMDAVPASVKTVNLAGEALSDAFVEQIYANTNCEKVYNLYGPTETTTYSTYTLVRRGSPVTIGRPIAGTQCYILDSHRGLVPIGEPGELYIAGDGLARGYFGQPEMTNERFVSNPFSGAPEARMYRTGDLCRWLADGNIQYLGRMDHQVKLRGFRIELGEIETVVARHPAVREVAVIAREDTPGDKRLAAYLVPENPPTDFIGQLRALVRSTMPEYMVPAYFVTLEKMPRTPNGKLDRKALPAPSEGDGAPRSGAVAPRTPTEEMVATAFRSVLGHNNVGVLDNFFDLGGHSLMAARLMSTLRAASGAELSLRDLFTRPTVAGLAEAIDALQWLQISSAPGCRTAIRDEVVL
jgi:amino acid adenylation domain-containing protein